MTCYDAVIIGAGPAGGQCARELAGRGAKVLLIDKYQNYLENNYSSGGTPLDLLSTYDLPESIVGTFWNRLCIRSTNKEAIWESQEPFGPVVHFEKLRGFLAEETSKLGGEVRLGCLYQCHRLLSSKIEVTLKDIESAETFTVFATVLVDATGTDRKVLASKSYDRKAAIAATGIEYHIEVSPDLYAKYGSSLTFFLGQQWMPQGYGWIFPLAPNRLKVGVIRYFQNLQVVPHHPSYQHYLEPLVDLCSPSQIIDKHGKTLHYSKGQADRRYAGPVIAIGDAISSVNPLGWEGIRHAMASGRRAAETIHQYLNKTAPDLSGYDREMNGYFGLRWRLSERMMQYLFQLKSDILMDETVDSFKKMDSRQIMQVIFDYRFRHASKSFFCYFFRSAYLLLTGKLRRVIK